jgi:hypothetical protein
MVDELLAAYFTHVHVSSLPDVDDIHTDQAECLAPNLQAFIHTL